MVKRFRYNVARFLINRENDGGFTQYPGKGMPGYKKTIVDSRNAPAKGCRVTKKRLWIRAMPR
jgi:hypothetical protein